MDGKEILVAVGFFVLLMLVLIVAGSAGQVARGCVLCRDGWRSRSVGRGTCSWHGGIA
jgi:hypothetical protein